MKPLILSSAEQEEAITHLRAVRKLGLEMAGVFARAHGKGATEAHRGAETVVLSIDRVLEILDAPTELYGEGDT